MTVVEFDIDFGEENINQTAAIVQVKRTGNNVMV